MRKILYPVLIIGFVVFSLIPTLYELLRAGDLHSDRQFELVHNFYTDYNFYLSRIREGLDGRLTVVEKYTSEPHAGGFIHEMYLLMGTVGRYVRVPWWRAGDIYHVARIVLAVVLLAMIAAFCKRNLLAFLLAVTASTWPILTFVDGVPRFGGYMPWWSVMDSLQRITFIPHLLAGQALMIFLVMELTSPKLPRAPIFLGILAFVLGMIFPPGLIFVIGVVEVFWVIGGREKKYILSYVSVFAIAVPSLLYLGLMTSMYPWHRLAELDILHPLPFDYLEYFKAVGPIGVIGVIGGIWAIGKKEKTLYPAVAWVLAWMIFLVVFHFIPQQSPLRFSEMIPHVGLGILAAYFLSRLGRLGRLGYLVLIGLGLLQMYSSWLWQKDFVDHKIRATQPLVPTGSYVMYPLRDFYMGIVYIKDATNPSDVILSETTAGNYIPVYSGNTVYVGHDNTVKAESKRALVWKFFSGNMDPEDARTWLIYERIKLIYFGPQEREDSGGKDLNSFYPFLIAKKSNAYVTIYSIK